MLIGLDKSTHEMHLIQPLQTNHKQFKMGITFLTGYNGIFNVTSKNNKFCFAVSLNDDDFSKITIPERAYEVESLDKEFERIVIEEDFFTETNYPFKQKSNFSTVGKIIKYLRKSNCFSFR